MRPTSSRILDRLDATHAFCWRWRWPIRLVMAVLLSACFGPWAYTRMTTPPADTTILAQAMSYSSSPTPLAADDPARPLFDAIARIPAPPAITAPATTPVGRQWRLKDDVTPMLQAALPAPAGSMPAASTWTLEPVDAASGPWTPDTRYHLQQIIAYLEDPKVTAALDEVRQAARQLVKLPHEAGVAGLYSRIRGACKTLCAHARYEMAERRDVEAACRDIEAVFDLADRTEDGSPLIGYLIGVACRALALEEIVYWTREFDLTDSDAHRLQQVLRRAHVDIPRRWRRMVQGETAFQRRFLVDGLFTKDASGDGWLVLYAPQVPGWGDRTLSALNLLSVVVNDRRTIEGKIAQLEEAVSRVGDLPFLQAQSILERLPNPSQSTAMRGNPADGPTWMLLDSQRMSPKAYQLFVNDLVLKQAAEACLAISVYKTEHGRYPVSLGDLVPDLLPDVPGDPIDGKPLRYRLDEQGGWVVYSIGPDAHDDGGPVRDAKGQLRSEFEGPDYVFTGRRGDPSLEWYLEAAPPAAGAQTQSTSQEGPDRDN